MIFAGSLPPISPPYAKKKAYPYHSDLAYFVLLVSAIICIAFLFPKNHLYIPYMYNTNIDKTYESECILYTSLTGAALIQCEI